MQTFDKFTKVFKKLKPNQHDEPAKVIKAKKFRSFVSQFGISIVTDVLIQLTLFVVSTGHRGLTLIK